jgi:hypothetical protein
MNGYELIVCTTLVMLVFIGFILAFSVIWTIRETKRDERLTQKLKRRGEK